MNFRGTVHPMCRINDVAEDTEHFFLQCHAYNDQRHNLLGTINEIFQLHDILHLPISTLVEMMLYGDKRFSHNQNKQVLESTLKFIHALERFS